MPLHSGYVGMSSSEHTHEIDARWLMAYSASLGDFNSRYFDTERSRVLAHPLFPVCIEWPVNLEQRVVEGLPQPTAEENARSVHGSHDLHIFRPISAGDVLTSVGTLVGLRETRTGAVSTIRIDTIDKDKGDIVARTYQTGYHRAVELQGGDRASEDAPELPCVSLTHGLEVSSIEVPEGAAHVYSECARIWNPIHTDRSIALAAGLPDIILHGTATMAMAVSSIVDTYAGGEVEQVTRVGGRFSEMVFMPSTLSLETYKHGNIVSYQVRTESGGLAIKQGFVCLSDGD